MRSSRTPPARWRTGIGVGDGAPRARHPRSFTCENLMLVAPISIAKSALGAGAIDKPWRNGSYRRRTPGHAGCDHATRVEDARERSDALRPPLGRCPGSETDRHARRLGSTLDQFGNSADGGVRESPRTRRVVWLLTIVAARGPPARHQLSKVLTTVTRVTPKPLTVAASWSSSSSEATVRRSSRTIRSRR